MVGSAVGLESCAVRILTDHREESCQRETCIAENPRTNTSTAAAAMIKCSLSERRQIRFQSHPGDALWEIQASDTVASKIILGMPVVEPSHFVISMFDDNDCEI